MNQRLKIWAQYFLSKGSPSNNHRLKEPGQVHTGSLCNPQSCLRALRKTEYEVKGRAVQPARGPYQFPEALVFAWILTAQNICRQTVHLTHMQSDPIKEVKEERAGWEERDSSHTKTQLPGQQIPLSHSTDRMQGRQAM